MLENKIIIVGYSGHSYVLIDSLIQLGKTVFGYTEKEIKKFNPYDLEYLGNEYNLDYKYLGENYSYSVAIGNNDLRTSISKFLRSKSCNLINVIHPDSSISKSVSFGSGIFIARNVSINPFTKIEDDVMLILQLLLIMNVSDMVLIFPLELFYQEMLKLKKSFIGANSVIKEGVEIGDIALLVQDQL